MKVFVEQDYEEYGLSLTPVKKAKGQYLRQSGTVYEIPKGLVRRYTYALEACEALRDQINEILDGQEGEPSPYRNEDNRPKPHFTTNVFQLRHVKTRTVMTELHVPVNGGLEWRPQLGQEPDGECQWWGSFVTEDRYGRDDFVKIGGVIRYDTLAVVPATVHPSDTYDKIGVS